MKLTCVILIPLLLSGAILFDDNLKDSTLNKWSTKGNVQCIIDPKPNKYWLNEAINPDFIRLQYHGIVSMLIYDDSDNIDMPGGDDNARGLYMVNTTSAVSTEFLSVVVTNRSGYPWPPTIKKINGTTMLGAEINSQVVILYGKGQTGNISNVTYEIDHAFSSGLRNVLSDLQNNHAYCVYLNGMQVTSFISTDCGTGYFVVASAFSENQIEVTDTPHE